ncbi:MAG: hypothetical protein ACOC2D_03885 [Spirochaetota bacterium]
MIGFGFFPFGFIFPLIFFVIIARVASGFFRSSRRRHTLSYDDDYLEERVRSIEQRANGAVGSNDEARIFKLAYRLKGRITVSDVVVETGLGVHEAEGLVQSMVDGSHVRMEVDDRGIVTYEFPEIIRRFENDS